VNGCFFSEHSVYKPLFRHMAAQTDKQTKEMHRKTK